ncbi:MAG: phytanoyl-CoA dioxygenase family protein [Geminicoccaceae bacterium]|nr:phytanoyl-CoA dioxygenase family protein [Geminicoccaceae bacterium]
MLSRDDIAFYETHGYLMVEDVISAAMLDEMRRVTYDLIDRSRNVTESDEIYDLDRGHGPETPRLTRIKLPTRVHEIFDRALRHSGVPDVLVDLLGPAVALRTSKLNTKAPGGGAAVEWHQDWAFYPHTNDSLLACGLMLEDVDRANGPLMVIPGSHEGPTLSHHNARGEFCGAIDPDDPLFDMDRAVTLTGKAGSMTVHHVRTLHGSAPNTSDRARLILFFECQAADAWPLLGNGSHIDTQGQAAIWADMQARMIRGEPTNVPRVVPAPIRLPLPPAPVGGSIFKTQESGGARSAFRAA